MTPDAEGKSQELEELRPYLRTLAQAQVESHLQAKIDPSDIVQQTMLDAHQARPQFRGQTPEEMRAWLRRILARNLADQVRRFRRDKRDAALEVSLQAALKESEAALKEFLAAPESALPDQQAMRNEQLVRLAEAIEALPAHQKRAVMLHHLQGRALAEVSQIMNKSETSVAGLLRRGLKSLRGALNPSADGAT